MPKKRVFVSFDFDNDRALKEFIVGQARLSDSPFEIIDTSLKEAAPLLQWEARALAAIIRSDLVLVMVGHHTWLAPGVRKEINMALANRIPICQIIGYRDSNPRSVTGAGKLYPWNWDVLKQLLR